MKNEAHDQTSGAPAPDTSTPPASCPPKRPRSEKQIAASRRNALKSTGPKTPRGCAVSKMNALKHGILSREVVVRGSSLHESARGFTALQECFKRDLKPVGSVEEMLVDHIVITHWRFRRALKTEAGEIALSVDRGRHQRSREALSQFLLMQGLDSADPIASLQDSALGTSVLQNLLRQLREKVEKQGELTEADIQELVKFFGGKPNELTKSLADLRQKLLENPEGLEPDAVRRRDQSEVLALMEKQLNILHWRKTACQEREAITEESCQAAAILPETRVLDRIVRYETMLNHELFHALRHLERLQRRRQAEAVPPPPTLEVSKTA